MDIGFIVAIVLAILVMFMVCNSIGNSVTPPTKPRPDIAPTPSPGVLKTHDYCGVCDPCQKTYIEQKMKVVQQEIEARDKRIFEQSVAKELAEIRKKEGLDIPLAQADPAAYWESEYRKAMDKLGRAQKRVEEIRMRGY